MRLCMDASSGCLCQDDSVWCFVRMIPFVRRNHLGACVGMIRRDVSVRMHLPGASVGVNLVGVFNKDESSWCLCEDEFSWCLCEGEAS